MRVFCVLCVFILMLFLILSGSLIIIHSSAPLLTLFHEELKIAKIAKKQKKRLHVIFLHLCFRQILLLRDKTRKK